jgi:ABC-2 type transport system ATP-binding protein
VTEVAISVDALTKRFGDRLALDSVSFEVPAGEVFGFLGPNGAGKTTTVRILGTLVRPTSGTAEVAGVALGGSDRDDSELRRRISVMTENPGLYLRLTVHDNLEYFAGLYGLEGAAARQRIVDSLETVEMANRANEPAGSLSKGLRQRVSLARALLAEPRILFLDEPTSGLDPVATREVRELIEALRTRGVTVFLTTHRLEEAERLCDRIAIVSTTLRLIGTPEELRRRLFASALEVRLAAPLADPAAVFGAVDGVTTWTADGSGGYVLQVRDPPSAAPGVARAVVGAGADLVRLDEVRHTLEDVYLQLIDQDVEVLE